MDAPVVIIRQPGRTPLHLIVRDVTVVGRDCEGVLLTDPQMSRRHLQLKPAANDLTVTDLGSMNGTTLDGERLTAPVRLTAGHVLRMGETTIERVGGPAASPWDFNELAPLPDPRFGQLVGLPGGRVGVVSGNGIALVDVTGPGGARLGGGPRRARRDGAGRSERGRSPSGRRISRRGTRL